MGKDEVFCPFFWLVYANALPLQLENPYQSRTKTA